MRNGCVFKHVASLDRKTQHAAADSSEMPQHRCVSRAAPPCTWWAVGRYEFRAGMNSRGPGDGTNGSQARSCFRCWLPPRPTTEKRGVRVLWPPGHFRHVFLLGFLCESHPPTARNTPHRYGVDRHLENFKPALLCLCLPSELLPAVPALHLPVCVPHRRYIRIVRRLFGKIGLDRARGHALLTAVVLKTLSLRLAPMRQPPQGLCRWSLLAHVSQFIRGVRLREHIGCSFLERNPRSPLRSGSSRK